MNARTMKSGRPRILLAEDDTVSRAFLAEAMGGIAEVTAVDGAGGALEAARQGPGFALWLLDAHLPDGDGVALLRALRKHAPATPALAHTADPDPAVAGVLRAAGFRDVLLKPIAIPALREAIRGALGQPPPRSVAEAAAPPWQPRLQRMFIAELPGQRDALCAAIGRGECETAQSLLHRLRGACATVGAIELDAAVRALQASPGSASAWLAFDRAVAAALRVEDAAEVGQQVP
ncbi:MAG: response regulator [Lysobacteraceae bacterium]|nr:MAG: response regulator [Xanthomonadaceae bacterium]